MGHVKKQVISEQDFEDVKSAVNELVTKTFPSAFEHANIEHADDLLDAFQAVKGNSKLQGRAGLSAALDEMTCDMVGETEKAWFQKVSDLAGKLMNSIANRPLNDPRPFGVGDMTTIALSKSASLVTFSQLNRHKHTLDKVFPKEQGIKR